MKNEEIITEKRDKVGVIILNRPEAKNTFTVSFARELNDALLQFDDDPHVRAVVIRAEGDHFSFGIDLTQFDEKTPEEYRSFIRSMDEHNHTIARMKKPVIASVQGYAVANGAGLAFACDFTVAAEGARFGTTAVNVGLICLGPAGAIIPSVGRKKALEMVLTGEIMDAEEVCELGLVNRVVPHSDLEPATFKFAEEITKKSPLAVQTGKRGIYSFLGEEYHRALDRMSDMFAELCCHADALEGVSAFLEKRTPSWSYGE